MKLILITCNQKTLFTRKDFMKYFDKTFNSLVLKICLAITLFLGVFLIMCRHEKFLIFGHRGASGYEPENTIRSFKKALEMGVDGIELDVHACATGELVVMHDGTVNRTTNGHGAVVDLSYGQLKQLLVDGKEPIPTLEEVIDFVDRRVLINIELKSAGTARLVACLLQSYIQKGWSASGFLVSSFNFSELALFRQLCSEVKIGALFEAGAEDVFFVAKKIQANFVGLEIPLVSQKTVERMHKEGILVFAWTVNDGETANAMYDMQVDGIFSNYPDTVKVQSKVKQVFC